MFNNDRMNQGKNWLILLLAGCFSGIVYLTIRFSAWAPSIYFWQTALCLASAVILEAEIGYLFAFLATIAGLGAILAVENKILGGWIAAEMALTWTLISWVSFFSRNRNREIQEEDFELERLERELAENHRESSSYKARLSQVQAQRALRTRLAQGVALIGKSLNPVEIQSGLKEALELNFPNFTVQVAWINTKNEVETDPFEAWIKQYRRTLVVEDTMKDERFRSYFEKAGFFYPYRSIAFVPIGETMAEGRLGVAKILSKTTGKLSQEDMRVLDLYVLLGKLAFENASLHQKVEELAMHDLLTGAFTRKMFDERLIRECIHASRYKLTLSFALIDIDHFKGFNDKYGHQAGDHLLVWITQVIRESLREVDFFARYGGEEFVILMPEMLRDQAAAALDRIRMSIENRGFALNGSTTLKVTVSVGVASYGDETTSPHQLVRQADERLYLAKKVGRNRVVSS